MMNDQNLHGVLSFCFYNLARTFLSCSIKKRAVIVPGIGRLKQKPWMHVKTNAALGQGIQSRLISPG